MSKEPTNAVYNIVAFVFADPKKAKAVHDELKASKAEAKEQGYKIVANAVVEMDDKGKAHIHEGGHGGWGAVGGRRRRPESARRADRPAGLGRGGRRHRRLRREDRRPRDAQGRPGEVGRADEAQHLGHPGDHRGQGRRAAHQPHGPLSGAGGDLDGGR